VLEVWWIERRKRVSKDSELRKILLVPVKHAQPVSWPPLEVFQIFFAAVLKHVSGQANKLRDRRSERQVPN
jgi:hypothetical protein